MADWWPVDLKRLVAVDFRGTVLAIDEGKAGSGCDPFVLRGGMGAKS